MFTSLLVANRGEIARRIFRTARRMGLRSVAVYTEADRTWPHWREADEAVAIGEGPASDSYLSAERILDAARRTRAEAIHPGYGFLSENAEFAEACEAAGLIFIGPPPAAIRSMGSKSEAKALMARAAVPILPGYHGERQDPDFLKQKAYEIGYPVLVKAAAGGGGRGMRRIDRALDFEASLEGARREAQAAFGDDRMLLERFLAASRHLEVQVFADAHGGIVHLFERDCSVQRRHQKIIEEAPAPGLDDSTRAALGSAAVRAAASVGYRGAGTVEFIADVSRGLRADAIYFMEMNTRLQVEHAVTEAITGIDLVEWQIRVAAGEPLPLSQDAIACRGHAIEARLYAEDPRAGFRPSTGRLWAASFPSGPGLRVDSGVEEGSEVGPYYDAMLAKLIASGSDREEALQRLGTALQAVRTAGPQTNRAFLSAIVGSPEFRAGPVNTGFVDRNLEQLVGSPPDHGLAAEAILAKAVRDSQRLAAAARAPWSRTDGFEIGGLERRTRAMAEVEGRPVTAELAWPAGGPRLVLFDGAAPQDCGPAEIVSGGRFAFVLAGGEQLRVDFPDPLSRKLEPASGAGDVTAPSHGRIVALSVTVGDTVQPGDVLFVLEAMKMEQSIVAPLAGRVDAVTVAVGEQVEAGAPAVRIVSLGPEPVD